MKDSKGPSTRPRVWYSVKSRSGRRALGIAAAAVVLVAYATPVDSVVQASTTQRQAILSNVTADLQGAQLLGPAPPAAELSVEVGLPWRNRGALSSLLRQLYSGPYPGSRHYLTAAEFANQFAPTPADVGNVIGYFNSQGLSAQSISPDRTLIHLRGTTATIERAFDVLIDRWYDPSRQRSFVSSAVSPSLPAAIARLVQGVMGLSDRDRAIAPRTVVGKATPRSSASCPSAPGGGYTPAQLQSAYDLSPLLNAGINGNDEAVGLAEMTPFSQENITTFDQCYGLNSSSLAPPITVDGGPSFQCGAASPYPTCSEAEADIEVMQSIAPGASITVWEGGMNANPPTPAQVEVDMWMAKANADSTVVNSTRVGYCEAENSAQVMQGDGYFQRMAAQGQSFFAYTGDQGANGNGDCNNSTDTSKVDFPASDPWVTAVGGTELTLSRKGGYGSETAWADSLTAASAGGNSGQFPLPSWQQGSGVHQSSSNGMRQIPDVSSDGSGSSTNGYSVYTWLCGTSSSPATCWSHAGGTSLSSPSWAALAALADQHLAAQGWTSLGFADPTLYGLAAGAKGLAYPPFHDVTDKEAPPYPGALFGPPGPGWDYATGLGSYDAYNLVRDISGGFTPDSQADTDIGLLAAVTCPSAADCLAVGAAPTSGAPAVALQWNGGAWSYGATNSPASSALTGVACVSTSVCFAVGRTATSSTTNAALLEQWDGTTSVWTSIPPAVVPSATSSELTAIACPDANDCFAVGSYTGSSASAQPLTEIWNSSSNAWSFVPSPIPPLSSGGVGLSGVACMSSSFCFAVGAYTHSGKGHTLVESWNGSAWAVVPSPTPHGANVVSLNGIACPSTAVCLAVGRYGESGNNQALSIRWSASTGAWSLDAQPTPVSGGGSPAFGINSELNGITCAAIDSCFAVGDYIPANQNVVLTEQWNGTQWQFLPSPTPSGSTSASLEGAACASLTDCFAVGSASTSSNCCVLISQHGAWSIIRSPNSGTAHNQLAAMSCPSANFCMATGDNVSMGRALVEQWNGRVWSLVTSPKPVGTGGNILSGVSCTSASFCMAAGYNEESGRTLIEEWDGSSWSTVSSPNPGNPGSSAALYGVSCISGDFCVAAGQYYNGSSANETLVEEWDGSRWTIVNSPNTTINDGFYGVSCTDISFCMADGYYDNGTNVSQTLVEEWNGSTWSIAASPTANYDFLYGVSCLGVSFCMATGISSGAVTLIEEWDGTNWSIVISPNASNTYNILLGVSCISAGSCIAVGFDEGASPSGNQTLIENWDGHGWGLVDSPNTGGTQSSDQLFGTSCNTSFCMADGDYGPSGASAAQTLIEES